MPISSIIRRLIPPLMKCFDGYAPRQVIYSKESGVGIQVLPHLALGYYQFIASVLALALGVLWLCLSKRPCAALMRQLFLAPFSWLVSQFLQKVLNTTSFYLG